MLRLKNQLLIGLTLTLLCGMKSHADSLTDMNQFSPTAIFGEDNRQELYLKENLWKEIGHSIAGKVSEDHIVINGSFAELQGSTLGQKECPSNRFAEQVTVPSCTGFLVKPNVLVTAAHCIKAQDDCDHFYWVFEFALTSAGDKGYTKVNSNQVYKCKKIIARNFNYFGDVDYAILELDREVVGRKPLQLGLDQQLTVGQPIANIGHSSGLPLKFKGSASILNIKNNQIAFQSDLDTFHGDSGSPVFDGITGVVIGITSSGHSDHFHDGDNSCRALKVCKPGDNCVLSNTSSITNLKNEPIFIKQ